MCFFDDLRFLVNSLIDFIYEREILMNQKYIFS
mgnify:CR=1 FL=1